MITRIKLGQECKPHDDKGSWHAEYYNCKIALQIQCAEDIDYRNGLTKEPEQAFYFEGEHFCAKPGDYYWFNNQEKHWVINKSSVDRVTAIFCIKTDIKNNKSY